MTKFCFSRFVAAALIAISGAALVTASFDAEARRAGGGSSVGRQSSNVTQQRQATTPPTAASFCMKAMRLTRRSASPLSATR